MRNHDGPPYSDRESKEGSYASMRSTKRAVLCVSRCLASLTPAVGDAQAPADPGVTNDRINFGAIIDHSGVG